MLPPKVTELPLQLEPVTADPFAHGLDELPRIGPGPSGLPDPLPRPPK